MYITTHFFNLLNEFEIKQNSATLKQNVKYVYAGLLVLYDRMTTVE